VGFGVFLQSSGQKAGTTHLSSSTETALLQHYPERETLYLFSTSVIHSSQDTYQHLSWLLRVDVFVYDVCVCDQYLWNCLLEDNQEEKQPLYFSKFHWIPQQSN